MFYGLEISACVYIFVYTCMSVTFWAPAGPVIQDGVPGSYMLAIFKRVAHEESE